MYFAHCLHSFSCCWTIDRDTFFSFFFSAFTCRCRKKEVGIFLVVWTVRWPHTDSAKRSSLIINSGGQGRKISGSLLRSLIDIYCTVLLYYETLKKKKGNKKGKKNMSHCLSEVLSLPICMHYNTLRKLSYGPKRKKYRAYR